MAGSLKRIEKEVRKEKKEIRDIEKNLKSIKQSLVRGEPPHFSKKDVMNAFFGALIIGLTFVFKGTLIETALNISLFNISIFYN